MDMDTYERLVSENRRRGTRFDALIVLDEAEGSDEEEEEEEERAAGAGVANELPCPFCGEELDAVGLLCHMEDEHHAEANAGAPTSVHGISACLSCLPVKVSPPVLLYLEFQPFIQLGETRMVATAAPSDLKTVNSCIIRVCPICADKVDVLVEHMSSQHRAFLKDKWRNQQGSSGSRYSTLASLKRGLESLSGSSRAAPVSTVPDPLLSSFVGNFSEVDLPKDAKKEPLDQTQVGSDNLDQKAAESADEPLLPEVKVERIRRSQFAQGLVLSLIFDDIL